MKKFTIYIISLFVFIACESELDRLSNLESDGLLKQKMTGRTISPEEAAAQAIEFRNSLLQGNGLTRSADKGKGVASVYAWRSSEIAPKAFTRSTASELLPDTLLYIVNFEDSCGYALVSADALIPGVAAFVEKGTLTPAEEIENPGFLEFLNGYKGYIRKIDSLHRYGILDSIQVFHDSLQYGYGLIDSTEIPALYPRYILEYSAGPLLQTRWNQIGPYNNDCGLFDPNSSIAHNKAGCVAVAIGQVAAYYRYPSSFNGHNYDWDAMLEDHYVHDDNVEGSASVAQLIHDIGLLVNMNYGMSSSGANFDSISNCLNTFGYHYSYQKNQLTDFNAIKEDIANGHPVIVMGTTTSSNYGGHAWVIDGVIVKTPRKVLNNSMKRQYVHCNWGEHGLCNGYFIFGAFQTLWNVDSDQPATGTEAIICNAYYAFNYNNYAYHQIYPTGN